MPKEKSVQKLDEKFIVNLHGKDFCVYEGILNAAHSKKLKRLEVQILKFPEESNNFEVICQATAETSDGEKFSDVGDANPKNVNSKIVPHLIRMASTRAKSRVLRDLTNIGIATVEELGDLDDVIGNSKGKNNLVKIKKAKLKTTKPAAVYPVSNAQIRAISSLAKKRNMSEEEINKLVEGNYATTFEKLSTTQASSLIAMLQKSA